MGIARHRKISGMRSNLVFGVIAILIAGLAWGVLVGGWIQLTRMHGLADTMEVSFSSPIPIMQ
jgi:hypothetical protein